MLFSLNLLKNASILEPLDQQRQFLLQRGAASLLYLLQALRHLPQRCIRSIWQIAKIYICHRMCDTKD